MAGTHLYPPTPGGTDSYCQEPVSVASLAAAIKRAVLTDAAATQQSCPKWEPDDPTDGADQDGDFSPGEHAGVPAPACDPGTAPGSPSRSASSPARRAIRKSRSGRRFRDRPLPGSHVHHPTDGGDLKTTLATLKSRAAQFGLTTLPGTGSLTLATRNLPGGKIDVVNYVRLAALEGDPHAQTFLHVWDSLKQWEQKGVLLDDVCAAAGISPVKLLKAVVGIAYEAGCDVANLVAAQSHPSVVKQSIKVAQTPDGIEDRKLLFQHHGFIPVPRGTSITINASSNATANAASMASADSSVPSFLQDVETLQAPKQEVQEAIVAELPPANPSVGDLEQAWAQGVKDAAETQAAE